jgi:hypothetical protein
MEEVEPSAPTQWRAAEELVTLGFQRSRVVMMNEAHDGLLRCVRTRRLGHRVLPTAHTAGVRHLAMEALHQPFAGDANATRAVPAAESGYLAQPEMRELIAAALDLGWTLIPYEADMSLKPPEFEHLSREETNWRDDQQARNLLAALAELPDDQRLLVWCGNGHLTKCAVDEWQPMGLRFAELSGVEAFAIDQIQGVEFGHRKPYAALWVETYAVEIAARGGSAGFVAEEAPEGWCVTGGVDAFLLASDNALS